MKIEDILVKPILTEKATDLASKKVYLFEVNRKSDKTKIKSAVEKLYKVKVDKVRVLIRKGKKRKVGKKLILKNLPSRKIAAIVLSEGKIDLFPQA